MRKCARAECAKLSELYFLLGTRKGKEATERESLSESGHPVRIRETEVCARLYRVESRDCERV